MPRRSDSIALAAPFFLATVAAYAASKAASAPESVGRVFYISGIAERAEGPASAGNLEFTGILQTPGHIEVSLKNTATGRSEWVRLHDPGATYWVENFVPTTRTIRVRIGGVLTSIGLRKEAVKCAPSLIGVAADVEGTPQVVHVRPDGLTWTDPAPGGGRHPNDPGNAD